jgi:multidrug resistance efflux pump
MSKEQEIKKELVEVRSEEVEKILGYIPRWIIRWGITTMFIVIFVLLLGSWFFKYPDVISSPIIVITEDPPAEIVARVGGKIQQLFVEDNQQVKSGEFLAIIDTPANYQHVYGLKTQLDSIRLLFSSFDTTHFVPFNKNYLLGELQAVYEIFLKSYEDYKHFIELKYHHKKINSLKRQIEEHNVLCERLLRQQVILQEEFKLSQQQYERAKTLLRGGIISQDDFENSKSNFLQKEYSFEGTKTSLANAKIQISQLEQSILDLTLQYKGQKKQLQLELSQAYDNLTSRIAQWEYNYLLKSPINGVVSFNKYWSINQNVKAGDYVIAVVPDESSKIVGKLVLSIQGSGKVKLGQKVNIKFSNYPHMEYGMVRGIIKSKSLVPADNVYMVEVSLPDGLMTNYGKRLEFSQQMQGAAEIITEDIRLLERIFHPIKSLFKKHVEK